MIDIEGEALSAADRDLLGNPLVGGVILFARNFTSVAQLAALVADIHALRDPPLLVSVDQEGGRVQRFRDGFVTLPPLAAIGECYDRDPAEGLAMAADHAWMMASELRAVGIDFSFAPVVDLRTAHSAVIGDRALHADPAVVARLAQTYVAALNTAGVAAVGKHFPGHGCVAADSHVELPVDTRDLQDLDTRDLVPFRALVRAGVQGVMMAHVLYPRVDAVAAGYSSIWINDILRGDLGFDGVVFSDDLSMAGADIGEDYAARARAALAAGCDVLLVCNQRAAVLELLDALAGEVFPRTQVRLMRLHARGRAPTPDELKDNPRWLALRAEFERADHFPELGLGDDNLLG